MGPRSCERGRQELREHMIDKHAPLQWGRVRVNAEGTPRFRLLNRRHREAFCERLRFHPLTCTLHLGMAPPNVY